MKSMRRREFIKAVSAMSAASAFPTIISGTALGLNGSTAPSNRIVMGCIGTGGRGTFNTKAFMSEPDVQVVAVCDVDRDHLEKARLLVNERYGNQDCKAYVDFRELIARDDIDAVAVNTPDHWHGLISIAAAKAGKDIYCEKPLTNTIAEGRVLYETVQRYGRVLQTGSHERSRPNARYACELVRNGRIGKLHTIWINLPCNEPHHLEVIKDVGPHPPEPVPAVLNYDMWLGHTPWVPYTPKRCHFSWRFILDYGGGEMTDRGAHVIDLAQLGNGTDGTTPIEFDARGEAPRGDLFNAFFNYKFECKYANGVRMVGTTETPRGIKFEGTDGWIFIHIHGGELEAEPQSLLRETVGPDEIQLGRSPGHHRDFLDAVLTRKKPFAPVEVGYHTAVICHLLNMSMLLGRKLKWDPDQGKVIGDPTAQGLLSRAMRSPWHL
ncbi:MAG TPA: Gfo/Idh/MocA family oxidoreductase [Acidobacteriota bacterium]|mgnify:CR=1 FL=1|nr:Gfo/Idh/MocA family oxidoreductase [Acidobacteriota bacterium]